MGAVAVPLGLLALVRGVLSAGPGEPTRAGAPAAGSAPELSWQLEGTGADAAAGALVL